MTGAPRCDEAVAVYPKTLCNLAACGRQTVGYNFMPVLGWAHTRLAFPMPDGTLALRFDATALAAFEVFHLCQSGVERDYTDANARACLKATIVAGQPSA